MQSNGVIEIVASRGGGFHAAARHLSALACDIDPFRNRVEISAIGRDGEIPGVTCRNQPLTSASYSTPPTHAQDTQSQAPKNEH